MSSLYLVAPIICILFFLDDGFLVLVLRYSSLRPFYYFNHLVEEGSVCRYTLIVILSLYICFMCDYLSMF